MKKILYSLSSEELEYGATCDDFSFDLHEVTGKFTLRFYDTTSAEKRLTGAVAGVRRFEVERLA